MDAPKPNLYTSSNHDEVFMQRSMLFAQTLKDLRNIRNQLYSAAEFFEDSYHKNEHDYLLLESLKDYVSKALISTIDHLGSVASKVDTSLNQNFNEAFETNLRVLCIQQRLGTCQTYSDHEGLSQQSPVIQIPRYHKHYLLPDGCLSEAVKAEKPEAESMSGFRRQRASVEFPSGSIGFSFTKKGSGSGPEKRSRSASPSRFRIKRSATSASGPAIYRSISPNMSASRHHGDGRTGRERRKDIEVYSNKTKNLFKALLSIHKYKNDRHIP